MQRLERITSKLFGETALPSGSNPEIGQFGSALAGTYNGTANVNTIQALPAWSQGFIGAVTPTNQYPPLPEMTGFGKVLSYQQSYLLQQGLAEWDSGTTYYSNNFCSLNGIVYISNTNNNLNNNPTNDRVNWRIFENGGRSHNIFDIVIKDHVLSYEESYGFTLQGDWAYKDAEAGVHYGYPDFYAKCIDERDNGTETRITLGGNQIDVVIADNGHTYFDIADRAIVDAYFSTYGVAWYYGLDEQNEKILMPRNNYFFRMATASPGGINLPGAPALIHTHSRGTMDITGTFSGVGQYYNSSVGGATLTGSFYRANTGNQPSEGVVLDNTGQKDDYFGFQASRSWSGSTSSPNGENSIYGRQTNQIMVTSPNALLYICTGNTVDEHALTLNADLQNAIAALESQEQTSISLIGDAKDDAIDDIDDAKDDAIQDIQDETADVIQEATDQADRAKDEADRAEAAADIAVAGQVQADWTQNDSDAVDYIKNKPTGIVLETETQTITNKTISADDNTITDLGTINFASSALSGEIPDISTASSTKVATEYAVADALVPINQQINEIQLAKNPNLSIVGDITLNSGNASVFSASDYLQFPYVWDFGSYTWSIKMQFTTSNDVTTQQNILNSYYGIAVAIVSGKFVMSISSNGTSWDIANGSTGTYTVEAETTYTLQLSWDGSDYKLAYSIDETTFTDDITITSSTVHNATQEFVGASPNLFGAGTADPFDGTINLNKWNLTVNNLVVWYGMDDAGLASRANVSLNNLDSMGEARFTAINSSLTTKAEASVQTIQDITTLTTGTISLSPTSSIYKITPSASTTFTFDTSGLSLSSAVAYTFELYIDMSTVYSLTFPSSLTWQGGTAPDLSTTGTYFLVFRTIDGGTNWIGNLQGVW